MDNPNCDRCGLPHNGRTMMSKFNTDTLCIPCIDKEKKHPDYKKACDAEIEQVRKGNYNFEGIGLPKNYKV